MILINKQIFIINGSGGVGKDTFVELVSKYVPAWNYSSVDKVKDIAKQIGWNGEKKDKDRKFLSDLKLLTSEYCDMPFKDLQNKVDEFRNDSFTEFLFLHIREPEEIERAKKEFQARTVLVKRDAVEPITSNMADRNVFNYEYDFSIVNNGTLEELENRAQFFVEAVKNKKRKLYIDVDNTFLDSIGRITAMYNEDFSAYPKYKFVHPCQINTWGFEELKLADKDYINMYFNQPRFFKNVGFMDNAKEVVDRLKEHFDITFVSMGSYANLRLKEKWLKENVPYAKFKGLNTETYYDKSSIDMSDGVQIDDMTKMLETSNAATKICFGDDYPWNESCNFHRCRNWYDVGRYLMKGVTL